MLVGSLLGVRAASGQVIRRGVAVALSVLALPHLAAGQRLVRLARPDVELGWEFDGSWLVYPAAPGTTLGTFREWLALSGGGAVRDPGLVSVWGTLYPTWTQKRRADAITPAFVNTGDRLNYSAGTRLFGALPASFLGWANRSDGTEPGLFAGSRRFAESELGARLEARNRYVPAHAEITRRTLKEAWLPADGSVQLRDETLEAVRLTAQTRTLNLYGERLDLHERLDGRSFTSNLGVALHELRWGWGSSLRSAVRYRYRTGFSPQQNWSWTEFLHLRHRPTFASELRHEQSGLTVGLADQRLRAEAARFTVDPSSHVRLQLDGEARWQRYATGRRDEQRLRPGLVVSLRIPLGGSLNARVSPGYEWQQLEPSAGGVIAVVNEAHVIPASARFSLSQPFVDSVSVVVTSADETLLYSPGLDYRLVTLGEFIDVVALPQGRIAVGDTVLVDYSYGLLPDARARGPNASYGADLTLLGVTVYARRELRDLRSADATGSFLFNFDNVTAGVTVREAFNRLAVDVGGEYLRRELAGSPLELLTARIGVVGPLSAAVRWELSGQGIRTKSGPRQYESVSGTTALEWTPVPALRLRARGTLWRWEDQPGLHQRLLGGGLDADVKLGRTHLQLLADYGQWREGFEHSSSRLAVRLTRRF